MSTGRDFAVFSRPTALSKCRRPHFCGKIAAGGNHFTPPPATKKRWLRFRNHPFIYYCQDDYCCIATTVTACQSLHPAYCCIMPNYYIMPPIPPAGIAGAGSFSGISAMAHSVVRNIPATEAAFSRATRDTLVGSMTPASYMLTNSSVLAL